MHNEQIDWLSVGAFHPHGRIDWSYRITRPGTVEAKLTDNSAREEAEQPSAVFTRTIDNATVAPVAPPSSTIGTSDMLSAADMSRYLALFAKMRELDRDPADDEDWVEPGALRSARQILGGMLTAKWSPPRMTWQVPEAIVFYWAMGDVLFAITVTEGEMGYLERRGAKIAKRQHSIPVDQNCLSFLL